MDTTTAHAAAAADQHTTTGPQPVAVPAETVVGLGRLVLRFGRTHRLTRHDDGVTPESDTDHTVMLALVACALAPMVDAGLDVGLVAQYALVHDLVEAYAGDTNTLRALNPAGKADKRRREQAALERITAEFATLPWLPQRIGEYESRRSPEARYVWALDKLMPKVTHLLNGARVIRTQGMDAAELRQRYTDQAAELRGRAGDFPALLRLHAELVARVLSLVTDPAPLT
jgi:putative hydrolase of HD superfamily